jgi:hypothetical protein
MTMPRHDTPIDGSPSRLDFGRMVRSAWLAEERRRADACAAELEEELFAVLADRVGDYGMALVTRIGALAEARARLVLAEQGLGSPLV